MRWSMWNPWTEMDSLRREIDRVFEGYGGRGWRSAFLPGSAARTYPLVNVSENAEEYTVEALAPGLDKESLEVSVKGHFLTVTGEKKPLEGIPAEAYHRSERATGRFVRTVELGSDIDEGKVSARYVGGMLRVTLPKAESAKPRQIQVRTK